MSNELPDVNQKINKQKKNIILWKNSQNFIFNNNY